MHLHVADSQSDDKRGGCFWWHRAGTARPPLTHSCALEFVQRMCNESRQTPPPSAAIGHEVEKPTRVFRGRLRSAELSNSLRGWRSQERESSNLSFRTTFRFSELPRIRQRKLRRQPRAPLLCLCEWCAKRAENHVLGSNAALVETGRSHRPLGEELQSALLPESANERLRLSGSIEGRRSPGVVIPELC